MNTNILNSFNVLRDKEENLKNLLIVFIALFITSCSKESEESNLVLNDRALIFGQVVGECQSEDFCIEVFKLENGKLFEDTNESIPFVNWSNDSPNWIEFD